MIPDNYAFYQIHERQQNLEYERYRQAYLDGEISEEEWEEIQNEYSEIQRIKS